MIKTYRFMINALSALMNGLSVLINEPDGSDEAKSYMLKAYYQKIFDFRSSEAKLRSSVAKQR